MSELSFIPPLEVAREAQKGIDLRNSLPPSKRCCTSVGIRRGGQLANQQRVSISTIKRMVSYFARHEVDKKGKGWGVDSKGYQAWLLWGGDSGRDWAEQTLAEYKAGDYNTNPLVGYKVMRVEGGRLVSGADSRQSFPARVGTVMTMSGHGIYMSPNKQYVLDYYSGLADDEVLLTLAFRRDDIVWGNLDDRESEVAVKKAKIVDMVPLDEDSYVPNGRDAYYQNRAPGYQSYAWTTQDWRVVIVKRGGDVDYSDKCGAPSNSLSGGRKRLCLPKSVIQRLLRSKSGKEALVSQARKKEKAPPGRSVRWHPLIKEYHRDLEARTVKDKPQ